MLLATALSLALTQAPLPLTTVSEQSGWTRTGRYSEVESLCRAFPKAFPGKVRCDTFGTTPEGRPMLALIASADGTLTPAANTKKKRPVVFFQGGIHAGEIDGKDAGFALLRDLLAGKTLPGVLKDVTAVFVPVFNVDGHERFAPNNRPNQVGPEEMGWRTTGQNFNLNRDYVKADAPEMVALLRYLNTWDALIYADLHVTDGAKFEPDVAIAIEPLQSGPAPLRTVGVKLMKELLQELETQGHQPLDFYPSFREDDDPMSGFAYGVPSPRFSHAYAARHRRFGVLVETHSWKPYAQRVKATRNVVASLLRMAARDGAGMLAAVKAADAEAQAGQVRDVVLAWKNTAHSRPIAFRGYAYERGTSEVSGQTWIRYDDSKPQVWTVPYFDTVEPALTVTLPSGGYLVPPAHAAWVSQKLTTHGLSFQRLSRPTPASDVEVFRATESKWSPSSNEGHQTLSVKGAWEKQSQALPAGTLYVPVAQPGVELVAHLFEPSGPDSLLSWGFFNAHFEQKEYIEDYVLEPFARELLAKDAAVKAAWDAKLKDPAFAQDARARLRFFYERHPARDTQLRVYPVLRTAAAPAGLGTGR
ncbi:M14 family peptidase [Myxococcus stipitatus DSM 14675]|uniref:M14 family peptidase n=1 Tax=Myxococcus stipitatus (strain DSM 14675 / JCM 12634 / Mx s8) TaxID=1278073 RepID=L7U0M7_MYXSD|nr:M14 family metallopeptidase [Myxococcus stipitatus]AGC42361.1 M14 family peptidase [Myxococcus stipitatus DSM 14675]